MLGLGFALLLRDASGNQEPFIDFNRFVRGTDASYAVLFVDLVQLLSLQTQATTDAELTLLAVLQVLLRVGLSFQILMCVVGKYIVWIK